MRVPSLLLPVLMTAAAVAVLQLAPTSSTAAEPQPTSSDAPVSQARVELTQQDTPAGTVQRSYLYSVPTSGAGAPRPLVLVLHGRSQSVETVEQVSGLETLGERDGFVTAFPGGYDGVWNSGTCCDRAGAPRMPDVAFLDQVLDDVSRRTSVDPARVYVVGYSNGGMMAYRYACQRSNRVAGVGVVSGSMSADGDYANAGEERCRPSRPVSVLAVHGGRDATVPYDGGPVAGSEGSHVAPVRAGIDQFAVAAGCRSSRSTKVGSSQRLDYSACTDGAAVRLVKLPQHGHGWTRDSQRYGYDTTAGLWAFLSPRRVAP